MMNKTVAVLVCWVAWMGIPAAAQSAAASPAAAPAPNNAGLEAVLSRMDATAAGFKFAQADFVWDQYQKVVNDTDPQKGEVYFRRSGKVTEMAADITDPTKKYVLYDGNKVQLYEPKSDQVTQYGTGKNRAEFESFLVLGFGGRGHDLLKSFEVNYLGTEDALGVRAAKLQLTPRTQKGRNIFDRILLWIDPAQGVSVQQQFFEPSGDYRLAKYSNIKLNQNVPNGVFKLKTTGRTKFVNPQSGL